ncbi:ATP-binding protein [Glycomyces sp. NRRL B-16210]|uniref:sensor histidine kinase n=1 Tax=Glycomyces sp. NRRL B-16210 TaxID=1463821 RepID=UPI0009DFB41D|nr:ATP-binding protein [Glycomyces sp. NRRL B-16210]
MSRKARQRTSRLPIRMQLMLPIAAALMGMLVLGLFQTISVWDEYQNATDAEVLAELSAGLNRTLDVHQAEAAPLVGSVINGGGGQFDAAVARRETDRAFADLETTAAAASERFPDLEDDLDELFAKAHDLEIARAGFDMLAAGEADFSDTAVEEAYQVYRGVADQIVGVASILPRLVDDATVSAHLDSLAAVMQASRIAAEIQFTVAADLAMLAQEGAVVVGRDTLSTVSYLSGSFDRQIVEFKANASAQTASVYRQASESREAEAARQALGIYLRGNIPSISPQDFSTSQGSIVAALDTTQESILDSLDDEVDAMRDASSRTLLTTLALVIVLALTAIISAAMLARRISLRVDGVREATLTAAYDTLPKTVAAVSQAGNADEVDRLLQAAKRQTLMASDSRYADELDSLAEAFSAAHHQALRQTANQALLRIDVEAMMKTLARRGQSLIRRQQQVMEALVEGSPGTSVPDEWRSVYHLLARMRRNEENLLLLAGGDPQRRYSHPSGLEAIIRDAVAEIEDAGRVVVENPVAARLETKPAGDLVRILAELLDNAAAYSPPTQSVRVTSRRTGSEIVISIADDGIGLAPEPMAAINRRLAEPTQLNSELTATMGLLVVGRLAAEHSISVQQLHSTMGKGTLALVRIPASAHAEDPVGLSPDGTGGSAARLALSARAANLPVTGTGAEAAAPSAVEPIVPRPRKAGPAPEPRPVAGGTLNGANGSQGPAGPGSETLDVTFRKVNRALESSGRVNGAELPRRAPGTRLLPGSVPATRSGGGADIDPAEIRDRLAGFASGIAAAAAHEQRQ